LIIFAVYAVVVWFLAMRWRRQFRGFVVSIAGALLAMLITWGLRRIISEMAYIQLSLLLFAEAAIVGGMGVFIALLPRAPAHPHCPWCWYNTSGLGPDVKACPECGGSLEPLPPPQSWRELRRKGK
jgi:hypothetical protein